MTADTEVPPIAAMSGITVRFPGVLALDDVDFSLRPGEVHSLMGENGAGKSTLIKALTGVYQIDGGTITVDGETRVFASTADAQAAGISTVYQEVNLCQNLSVGENVMLGHEVRRARTHRLEGDSRRGRAPPGQSRAAHRHPHDALEPLHRHPAARRDQQGDGDRLPRPRARRADLEPRPRRGRAALRRDPRPARPGRRHPVRLALPRPGVRDLRPHHGAAQRQARRRVPCGRPDPRRRWSRKMLGRELADLESISKAPPTARSIARGIPLLEATGLGRRGMLEPADLEVFDGEVVGIAGLLGLRSHRARPPALRRRPRRQRPHRAARRARPTHDAASRHRPPHRVLVGGPARRGHHRRPHGRREHRARHPGAARLAAQDRPQ